MNSFTLLLSLQIALLPVYTEAPIRTDGDPISPGDMIYCNNFEFDINNLQDIPEICRKFMFSIGAAIQNQALSEFTYLI